MSKNNEIIETPEVIEENFDVVELEPEYDEPEKSGINPVGVAVGLGVSAAAIALLYRKFKGKIEERQVEKLKKKGYIIAEPVEAEELDDEDVDEDVEDQESEK